jgi:hypothetical protein
MLVLSRESALLVSLFIVWQLIYIEKRKRGPRIEPRGTPIFISSHLEDLLLSVTLPSVLFDIFLSDKIRLIF